MYVCMFLFGIIKGDFSREYILESRAECQGYRDLPRQHVRITIELVTTCLPNLCQWHCCDHVFVVMDDMTDREISSPVLSPSKQRKMHLGISGYNRAVVLGGRHTRSCCGINPLA